jgi:lysophospholipase L1-like esterase
MPRAVTSVVVRAGLLLFGLALAFALAEGVLRITGYPGAAERQQRVFDARYGEVPRDSWIWSFQIDRARYAAVELRGQSYALPKPAGETRVLFVGDSATEGAFVGEGQNYPRQFETLARARSPGRNIRAVNAGVWGMTTIDEYHLLSDKLLPLEPDVVVLGLFMANDINMNLGHRERTRAFDSWLDACANHSALVHFLRLRWLALSPQLTAAKPARFAPAPLRVVDERGLHMLSYPEGELAGYVVPQSQLIDHAYDVLASVLAQLRELGRMHGFTLRVLLIPSPSRVLGRLAVLHYPNLLAELAARGVKIAPGDVDVDLPTRRVLEVCASLGLACIDPTPGLQHLGARAFFAHDEHPTAAAHQVIAEALLAN